MPVYTWKAIYLGNAADIDTDETTIDAESPGSLLGTYGSTSAPLANNVVDVIADDADGDTNLNSDNDSFASSETMTIDGVAHTLDSGVVYNATLTYADGTTATITATVLQTTDGDLYLAPEMANNADKAAMEAQPIKSLTLTSVAVNPTTVGANRQQTNFVCFIAGTLIATPDGQRPVEQLRPGDFVDTLDHGAQPVRWIGTRRVTQLRQIAVPGAAPIVFPTGCFGAGRPFRTLCLSQQHRVLVRSTVAQRMFGSDQVICAAKRLAGLDGIGVAPARAAVEFWHFCFDRHEIVFANGLAVESLLIGPQAKRTLVPDAAPLESGTAPLPPDLARNPARPIAEGRRGKQLVSRLSARATRAGQDRVLDGLTCPPPRMGSLSPVLSPA